jgi:hypothetical protein
LQFVDENVIAMFDFEETDKGIGTSTERDYRLVSPEEMTEKDLEEYRKHSS